MAAKNVNFAAKSTEFVSSDWADALSAVSAECFTEFSQESQLYKVFVKFA